MVNLKEVRNFRAAVWVFDEMTGQTSSNEDEIQAYKEYRKSKGRQLRTEENFQVKILEGGPFSNAEDIWGFSVLMGCWGREEIFGAKAEEDEKTGQCVKSC